MTRITARQIAVQLLFAMEANSASAEDTLALFFSEEHYDTLKDEDKIYLEAPDEEQTAYIRRIVQTVEDRREEIDGVISRYSSGWKISRLTKSTLAILRCALCEILYLDDIPDAAAVNEAVELGKAYDSPQAGAFINGVLGSFLRGREQEQTEA
ncbi:MAG: transcription antitermination factor NusB [Oscillospiraceae bacterium]|nr:transcription antitermination factor NusB [Oscillospiraceae bacterium]